MSTPEQYPPPSEAPTEAEGTPGEEAGPPPGRARRLLRAWGGELLTCLLIVLVIAGLGAPLGVAWSAFSPRVLVQMTTDGAVLAETEPEEYIGSDATFTLIGLGVGVLLGLLCWFVLRRRRGPGVLLGLGVGSLLGACIAWQVGRRIGLAEYADLKATAQVGWQFYRPPSLGSGTFITVFGVPLIPRGALAAQALAAVFTYTMLAGWSRHPELRSDSAQGSVSEDIDHREVGQ